MLIETRAFLCFFLMFIFTFFISEYRNKLIVWLIICDKNSSFNLYLNYDDRISSYITTQKVKIRYFLLIWSEEITQFARMLGRRNDLISISGKCYYSTTSGTLFKSLYSLLDTPWIWDTIIQRRPREQEEHPVRRHHWFRFDDSRTEQHLLTFHVQFVSAFHWKLIASTTIKDSYYFFFSLPNLIFSCHNLWIISLKNIQRYRNVARFVNDNPNDVIKLEQYFLIRNASDSFTSYLHIFKNDQLPNFLSFSDSFAVQEAFDLYRHSHSLDS